MERVEAAQRKLQEELGTTLDRLEREVLRPIERRFYEAAAECLRKHADAPAAVARKCVATAMQPFQRGSMVVNEETQRFSQRLQMDLSRCEDDARLAGGGDRARTEEAFAKCGIAAFATGEKHLAEAVVPAVRRRIEDIARGGTGGVASTPSDDE